MQLTEVRQYTKRAGLNVLSGQMKNIRQPHEARWRQIAAVTRPDSVRWLTSSNNRGERQDQEIMDCTATTAAQTLSAGMMAGITSPARPWFQLSIGDASLSEVYAVKEWLDEVTERMRKVLLRSNFYKSAPAVYEDLGDYATAPMWIEEDEDTTIWTQSLPLGSYWISADRKGRVNTYYREFPMTVRNIVDDFCRKDIDGGVVDWSRVSNLVRTEYQQNHMETTVDICHMVYPNPEYKPKSALSKHKKYSSCYYEMGRSSASGGTDGYDAEDQDKFLRESGYDYFPLLCPRWKVYGEDVYGTSCPGMTALGDNNQLQHGEIRRMQAVDQVIFPPTVGPTGMKRVKIGALGETTYTDEGANEKGGWRAIYQIDPRFAELDQMQEQLRSRIKRVYLEDLFLMMTDSDRRQITAEEIRVRQQEKLLRVGPVLEQLNQDFLDPLIEIMFAIMVKQGQIPPAPDELMGASLTVQYVSIMAQAQKAIGLSSYHELSGFAVNLAAVYPQIFDTLNVDKMVEKVATALGVPAECLNPPEMVAATRQQRAQAQQAAAMAEQAKAGAGAVKDLADAQTSEPSALSELLQRAQAGQLVNAA